MWAEAQMSFVWVRWPWAVCLVRVPEFRSSAYPVMKRHVASKLTCSGSGCPIAMDIGLKALQGLIWKDGYASGELKGHIFNDVHTALQWWNENGVQVLLPLNLFGVSVLWFGLGLRLVVAATARPMAVVGAVTVAVAGAVVAVMSECLHLRGLVCFIVLRIVCDCCCRSLSCIAGGGGAAAAVLVVCCCCCFLLFVSPRVSSPALFVIFETANHAAP